MAGPTEDRSWIQINNTVVPVVQRLVSYERLQDLVPLPVIQYGAGLLTDIAVDSVPSTPSECSHLSRLCARSGFEFSFPPDTKLVRIRDLQRLYKRRVVFTKLPNENPFAHAQRVKLEASCAVVEGVGLQPEVTRHNLSPEQRHAESPVCPIAAEDDQPLDLSRKQVADVDVEMAVSAINGVGTSSNIDTLLHRNTRFLFGREVRCVTKRSVDFTTLREIHHVFFSFVPITAFFRILHSAGVPGMVTPDEKVKREQLPLRTIRFGDVAELVVRIKLIIREMKHVRTRQKRVEKEGGNKLNPLGMANDASEVKQSQCVHHTSDIPETDVCARRQLTIPPKEGSKKGSAVCTVKTGHELKKKKVPTATLR